MTSPSVEREKTRRDKLKLELLLLLHVKWIREDLKERQQTRKRLALSLASFTCMDRVADEAELRPLAEVTAAAVVTIAVRVRFKGLRRRLSENRPNDEPNDAVEFPLLLLVVLLLHLRPFDVTTAGATVVVAAVGVLLLLTLLPLDPVT